MSQTDIILDPGEGYSRVAEWRSPRETPRPDTSPRIAGLGRAILRRSKLLVCTIILLNIVAIAGVRQLTPRYSASSDILVGPREEQVVDLKAVLSGLSGSSDVIESEIQVLRSREIARGVVRKLRLDQLTEFNPSLNPPGPRQHVEEALRDAWPWLQLQAAAVLGPRFAPPPDTAQSPPAPDPAGTVPLDPLSGPVDRFLAQLDVAAKGRSRVITISFTSTDATLAAKVPNAVADAYVANQLRAKTDATAQAHKWLDERVAEMREQLIGADEAVEAYRRRAGIVPIRDTTLVNQQISQLGHDLMKAREQVADAEGRQQSVAAINPTAFGMAREVAVAKAREARLVMDMDKLRQQIDAGSQSEIGLRALQREADADRNLYDRLLARARETKIQSGLQQADATIISRAERPGEASFPKPALILPLFFVASCITAVLLVIWLESLDRGFMTPAQLEAVLGIPAIGAVPLVKRALRQRAGMRRIGVDDPGSGFAEAIRNLYTSLVLSGKDGAPRIVLISSSLPGEGKSSVALAIAGMMASCGKRVVVVDCDLRNPTVHQSFGVASAPGLTEYLAGDADLDVALRRDPGSAAWFMPVGEQVRMAPDLFSSATMRNLLQALARSFDIVLLDGGPVLGTSDTRHLCRLADRTIMVVRWHSTRCSEAIQGLRQLADAGATFAGALMTMVEPKHYQKYAPVRNYARRLPLYLGT